MCQELQWMKRGIKKYRIRHGELGYRRAMDALSPLGREIVYAIEEGRSFDELITDLAVREYHRGRGAEPTPAEIRPARAKFVREIARVRQVFDLKD